MPKATPVTRNRKQWWKQSWDKLVFLAAFVIFFIFYPGQNAYTVLPDRGHSLVRQLPVAVPKPPPYPINQTSVYPGTDISAVAVAVMDADSGVYLFKRNTEEPLAPASTTKIMTALVALDTYDVNDIVTVRSVVTDGQVMGLVPGERITVENLLFGTLVQSGNDAAYALADHYPGGVEQFVESMNQKAKALHLQNTVFTNPVGYDDINQKMTATDLAMLARVALANPTIAKMVAIPQITVSDVTHTYFHSMKNVNQLLGKVPGVGGIKTGWTEEAGENLVTLVERADRRIIIVVLRSKDRFGETIKLIDWVYANYKWEDMEPPYPR